MLLIGWYLLKFKICYYKKKSQFSSSSYHSLGMGSPSCYTFKHKPEMRSVPKDLKVSQTIEDCQLSEVTAGSGWEGELAGLDVTGMPWEFQSIWH